MEHLDLAGYITTPSYWTMPAFEQQDAIYLSSSRQMLEPILEETSEDEEHAQNSWPHYEQSGSYWSSAESETGSVIRIELNKDADSISERDFACPAKRARHSEDFPQALSSQPTSLDDTVLLRKHHRPFTDSEATNSLERFLAYEAASRDSFGSQQRNSTGNRRFDEFCGDVESYNSLSRSSSLVQFESLEKQLLLQEQHVSMTSLGNSSPSLLSFDGASQSGGNLDEGARSGANSGNNSRRGSQSSLMKRFDTSDARLHQTYYELNKLNFHDEQQQQQQQQQCNNLFGKVSSKSSTLESGTGSSISEAKSDSESSTTSSDSCDSTSTSSSAQSSILRAAADSLQQNAQKHARLKAFQRIGKSSAENLSEDSGYCEPSTLARGKSKSIPKNFEKFCEEEELFQQFTDDDDDDEVQGGDDDDEDDENSLHSRHDNYSILATTRTKINDATFIVESMDAKINKDNGAQTISTEPTMPTLAHTNLTKNSHLSADTSDTEGVADVDATDATSAVDCNKIELFGEHNAAATALCLHSHSPSPDSSIASASSTQSSRSSTRSSTTTAETCASAGSFIWQQHRELPHYTNFYAAQRNSLPDIREACTTELTFCRDLANLRAIADNKTDVLEGTNASSASSSDRVDVATSNTANTTTTTTAKINTVNKQNNKNNNNNIGNLEGQRCGGARHSVPNELNKLGRRRKRLGRHTKQQQLKSEQSTDDSSSGAEFEYNDCFDDLQLKLRRSCSWSERQTPTKTTAITAKKPGKISNTDIFGKQSATTTRTTTDTDTDTEVIGQSALTFGYMNASYQNLTLLDYSDSSGTGTSNLAKSQLNNIKRAGGSSRMSSRGSSKDYEDIICKSNFLLDELSEIYDRNASILNDKPHMDYNAELPKVNPSETIKAIETERLETVVEQLICAPTKESLASTIPKPPPRQRAHSHTSNSDVDYSEEDVQHIQLTIRKPPARPNRSSSQANTNSLHETDSSPLAFSTFGKTFDQDPTNLRTSYAQSLEKCNFDATELSTGQYKTHSIPKRRFHSQANVTKKRNLVSSTPNLNAFDPRSDELEDDIYVSSAHNSMHRLPQANAPKPLGILLPAGSRTSFGKEVSFCPVVSKYSWQEQSSEEYNEPLNSDDQTAEILAKAEESSDDELLDNADATVIYNTKENELIAERYNKELNAQQARADKYENKEHDLRETNGTEQRPIAALREPNITTTTTTPTEMLNNAQASAQLIVKEQENIASMSETNRSTSPIKLANTTASTTITTAATTTTTTTTTATTKRVSSTQQANAQTESTTPVSQEITLLDAATTNTSTSTSATAKRNNSLTNANSTKSVNGGGDDSVAKNARPFSLQLPILSEPPINRAHHILYASQQMLDHFQRQEQADLETTKPIAKTTKTAKTSTTTKQISQSVQNLSNTTTSANKMSKNLKSDSEVSIGASGNGPLKPLNNNNEVMKSKFKADEKHPNSKGFFTRFANGFRFSLRRNKKKQLQQQQQPQQQQQQVELVKTLDPTVAKATATNGKTKGKSAAAAPGTAANKNGQTKNGNLQQQQQLELEQHKQQQLATAKNENFIYIPLKGPLPADYKRATSGNISANTDNNSSSLSETSTASAKSSKQQQHKAPKIGANSSPNNNANDNIGKVMGKPPIPKQPPRAATIAGYAQSAVSITAAAQQTPAQHAQQSQEQTAANFTTALLDSERSFYYDDFKNQLNTGMHANNVYAFPGAIAAAASSSPSRGSVSQKTQMFNQLGGNNQTNPNGRIVNAGGHQSKIGLIETDLDTHETVITGKTRSLMDITSGPHGSKRFVIDKRLHIAGNGADDDDDIDSVVNRMAQDADDDDDDCEVIVDANGVLIKKTTTNSAGQIASVRRPHKSMEFLLDKENQKNVLKTGKNYDKLRNLCKHSKSI